jgi:hypothetical protein
MGAFDMALCEARFSGPAYDKMAESTIRGAISFVASTFRENGRSNPTKDQDGKLSRLLSRQYRAFKNDDPSPAQQKAIPICIVAELAKKKCTETQRAISQLAISNFYGASHSCEYLKVQQAEKRRTIILQLRCVRFFCMGRQLAHNNPWLEFTGTVSITYEWQKKDKRNDTVTHHATGEIVLCTVRQWAAVVR